LTLAVAADTVCVMNEITPPSPRTDRTWLDRLQAIIEVFLLSGLVSGFFAVLPFSLRAEGNLSLTRDARTVALYLLLDTGICLVLLFIVLGAHRETLRDLGVRFAHWRFDALLGFGVVPVLFVLNMVVGLAFRTLLPRYYIDRNPLTEIIHTPQELALFLLSAFIAGGIKEELQRAFILTRFRRYLGGAWVGLFVWSLAFGAGHYAQGLQGVAAAALFGFLFGLIYLLRGSLIAPIVAHSLYDTAALLGYWFSRN
jgi:membrane protease YdiL (CAAX protease family)